MLCPRCGNELRRSTKDPNYGLCDNCKKKYKWHDEQTATSKKQKPSKNQNKKASVITVTVIGILILAVIYIITPKKKSDEYIQQADNYLEQIESLGESYQNILSSQAAGEITVDDFMSQMGDANSQMMELTSEVSSLDETGYTKKIAEIGNLYSDMAREVMNYVNLDDSSASDNIASISAEIVSAKAELDELREQLTK